MSEEIKYSGTEAIEMISHGVKEQLDNRSVNYTVEDGALVITGGGFSSGSGDSKIEKLYESNSFSETITLSKSINNYDFIVVVGGDIGDKFYSSSNIYAPSDLNTNTVMGVSNESWTVWYNVASDTTFNFHSRTSNMIIASVYGIKLGSGGSGSGGFEEIVLLPYTQTPHTNITLPEDYKNYKFLSIGFGNMDDAILGNPMLVVSTKTIEMQGNMLRMAEYNCRWSTYRFDGNTITYVNGGCPGEQDIKIPKILSIIGYK